MRMHFKCLLLQSAQCQLALLLLITADLIRLAEGYASGAPCLAQSHMKPSELYHGIAQDMETNPPPLRLRLLDASDNVVRSFRPGQIYTVKLSGRIQFRGFLLQPRLATEPGRYSNTRVGRFIKTADWQDQGIRFQQCETTHDDSVTHVASVIRSSVSVQWMVEDNYVTNTSVQFVASIVYNQSYFWSNYAPKSAFVSIDLNRGADRQFLVRDAEEDAKFRLNPDKFVSADVVPADDEHDPCNGIDCKNDGYCREGVCDCLPGWAGKFCEVECSSELCRNGGTCIMEETENGTQQACRCSPGYSGRICETDIDECASNPCQHGGTCNDKLNGYTCVCAVGYNGAKCHRPCLDVYKSCARWKEEDRCKSVRSLTKFFDTNCAVTCNQCTLDNSTIVDYPPFPPALEAFYFLIGTWTGDMDHSDHFPLDFERRSGYNETLRFEVAEVPAFGTPSINYSAVATNKAKPDDIQVINGFLTLKRSPDTHKEAALLATSNNGVITIEEGDVVEGISVELRSVFNASMPYLRHQIPRASFRKFQLTEDGKLQLRSSRANDDGTTRRVYTNTYTKKMIFQLYVSTIRRLLLALILLPGSVLGLTKNLQLLEWMIGKWRSEFGGRLIWPSIPTMKFGEEIEIWPSQFSASSSTYFLNFTASAWSHSTRDHFHDEFGYLTVDEDGKAILFTTGNNGFATVEQGYGGYGLLSLKLSNIGRIAIARDLPVEDLTRDFRLIQDRYLEQTIRMRTATHPSDKSTLLEHSRILYEKVVPTTQTNDRRKI